MIEGTGLAEKETESRLFGNWRWDYSEVSDEDWEKVRPTLKERIKRLHDNGIIRYGSW